MRVLGVIPARAGSKGIPRKNIRLLCGKPLLQYTAEAALSSQFLTRVILSTDDKEIAEVGLACGVDVPFMRPQELANDDTPTLPVIIHAVESLEKNGDWYDAVCILQPTHPLRTANDVDACITKLASSDASAVVTTLVVPEKYNPHWVYLCDSDGYLKLSTGEENPIPRRQSLPPAFHREGSVYVVRHDVLMMQNSLYGNRLLGHPIPRNRSINIDTLEDWEMAEHHLCGYVV